MFDMCTVFDNVLIARPLCIRTNFYADKYFANIYIFYEVEHLFGKYILLNLRNDPVQPCLCMCICVNSSVYVCMCVY